MREALERDLRDLSAGLNKSGLAKKAIRHYEKKGHDRREDKEREKAAQTTPPAEPPASAPAAATESAPAPGP